MRKSLCFKFLGLLYIIGSVQGVYGNEKTVKNLLVNGDFEEGKKIALGWSGEIQHSRGRFYIDRKCRYSGQASQAIERVSSSGQLVRIQQTVTVNADTTYKITVFCKADCDYSVGVYEFRKDGSYKYHRIVESSGHKEWKKWSCEIHTCPQAIKFKLHICVNSVGTVWADCASIVPISSEPVVTVKKVKRVPVIDGVLSDTIWKSMKHIPIMLKLNKQGQVAKVETYAMICRDDKDKELYLAFYCREPNMNALQAVYTKRDSAVYLDDSVCVFFDTNYDRVTWFQICVNANGAVYDEEMLDSFWETGDWRGTKTRRGTTSAWNPDIKVAAYKGKDFWSVELAIPFKELRAKPIGVWGANFCRIRPAKDEFITWSYINGSSFHSPKQFGKLRF